MDSMRRFRLPGICPAPVLDDASFARRMTTLHEALGASVPRD